MQTSLDFFYRMPTRDTITPARIPGIKKKKEKITSLACCDADGCEKNAIIICWKVCKSSMF